MCVYVYVYLVVQWLSRVQLLESCGLQPARLLCPWNSPGKNTGVGCHFLPQGISPPRDRSQTAHTQMGHLQVDSLLTEQPGKPLVLVTQSCPNLCNLMDWSIPFSTVHGILQARILEWVAIPFSRGSFWSKDQTGVSCIAGRFFTIWTTREAPMYVYHNWKKKACAHLHI